MQSTSWHIQPTVVTVRLLPGEDADQAYADRVEPAALVQANLLGGQLAYLHAASRIDGAEISVGQWKRLALKLRREHGVLYLLMERDHRYIWVCTLTAKHIALELPGMSAAELRTALPAAGC